MKRKEEGESWKCWEDGEVFVGGRRAPVSNNVLDTRLARRRKVRKIKEGVTSDQWWIG